MQVMISRIMNVLFIFIKYTLNENFIYINIYCNNLFNYNYIKYLYIYNVNINNIYIILIIIYKNINLLF